MSTKVAGRGSGDSLPDDVVAPPADARRIARYQWAAPLASGKRVLDLGCEPATGAAALVEAGAAVVLGIHDAEAVVEVGRTEAPSGVTLQRAQLSQLPLPAASVDLALWFDTRGREAQSSAIVEEVMRVLKPEGLFLASTTDSATAEELRRLLIHNRKQVRLLRQYEVAASVVLDDTAQSNGTARRSAGGVRVVDGCEPGRESDLIVMAGPASIKPPPANAIVTGARDARRLARHIQEQEGTIRGLRGQIRDLRTQLAERDRLRAELRAAEQALAVHNANLEAAVQDAELNTAQLYRRSISWRVTEPLRKSKPAVKRLLGRALRAGL
ncbi:MAG: methyltransferase domain-containing protein [Acidimicrobiaceae bacterium]|nr:methyltransferase domain-containing protein [Acidimicrobiaceae bacterium]